MLFNQVIEIKIRFLFHLISKALFPVLSILVLMLCYSPYVHGTIEQSDEVQGLVPSNFLKWGSWGSDYVVLVDKSQQKVMLYRSDSLLEPVRVYQCSTGENGGRKSVTNDKKTPEGIYYFVNTYTRESLAPIYGAMALPLNYPNIFDIKEGRNGYGIWFHGLNKPLKPNDTSGCIALENKDIEELASYVTLFQTPVIISSGIEMVTEGEIGEKAKDIADIIEGWRDSWQDKDVDRYMSFYSLSFRSGSKDWNQWKDYKKKVTDKYRDIRVKVDNLGILMNNNVVIASFKQTYRTPVFESSGIKKLYITKNSEEWKIIGESFSLAEVKEVTGIGPEPETPQTAAIDAEQIALTPPQPGIQQEESLNIKQTTVTGSLTEDTRKGAADVTQVDLTTPEPIDRKGESPGMKEEIATTSLTDNSLDVIAVTEQAALITPQLSTPEEPVEDTMQIAATTPLPETPQVEACEATRVELTVPQPGAEPDEAGSTTNVTLAAPQQDSSSAEIEEFINSWIDAWEKKDTERYTTLYAAEFRSGGMNLDAWKRHKNKLNKRYESINIEIYNLKITRISDDQTEVSFVQEYKADKYTDHGEKNMILIKRGKEWKIKKEEWTAISG